MSRPVVPIVVAALLAAGAAPAQEPPATQVDPPSATLDPPAIDALSLDELFDRLKKEEVGARAGKAVEAKILERLLDSDSDTVDLMMGWAVRAMDAKNYPLALDILDQVIALEPGFVEGWNKRATVHFLLEDYGGSLEDIRQTLALEPRHFGALSGLGFILEAMDRDADALRAYQRALAINPHLERIRESAERLEKSVGDSI